MTLLFLLVLTAEPSKTIQMDLSGPAPATVQQVLNAHLEPLQGCVLEPTPPRPNVVHGKPAPVVFAPGTTHQTVKLAVTPVGSVAAVTLEGPGRLDEACVKRTLLRAEFGKHAGGGGRITVITLPVSCDQARCRYPWTPVNAWPAPPDATPAAPTGGTGGTPSGHAPGAPPSASPR